MVSLNSGWRFQIDIFIKKWTTNTSPASNRLFQEMFYLEVDVFYQWVLLKLFYNSTEHFSMLLYAGLLIIHLFSIPAIFPDACMFFCLSDLSLGVTVIPLPHFAGSPVSACFSSQTISQQTQATPSTSWTLVWFKGSYTALKNWTTIQMSVVLMVIRNQILCWALFSFFKELTTNPYQLRESDQQTRRTLNLFSLQFLFRMIEQLLIHCARSISFLPPSLSHCSRQVEVSTLDEKKHLCSYSSFFFCW